MANACNYLTALPVFNEAGHVDGVLDEVALYAKDILVVDDGSTDGTSQRLARRSDITVVTHPQNRGYGAALNTAFDYAVANDYDVLVTIDCDGQHQPRLITELAEACQDADIVSGSRYLDVPDDRVGQAPVDRRLINQTITHEINRSLGLQLTDAFCGFKAYRVDALRSLRITELGYAMPLELWVQAAHAGLRIVEVPVPLIYLEEERSFGGALDNAEERLAHYREVIRRAIVAIRDSGESSWPEVSGLPASCCADQGCSAGKYSTDWRPC